MDPQQLSEQPVPEIRKDLQIFQGPEESDGSPTFNVYDPVRAKYFKISWAEAAILRSIRPGMTLENLKRALDSEGTLRVTVEELAAFFVDADKQGLIDRIYPVESLMGEAAARRMNPVKAFLLYYLFFRIPLIDPDAFLARTLHWVKPFLSGSALAIYLCICVWGLSVIAVQWDAFFATFTYFFSVEGFVSYALAIMFTKTVHEFSHAYTAKKYGLRVPTMGIALLVLFPVLYTDVTDAWRLASRKKRMLISAAGVIAESTIAAVASILWAYSEPGILQSVFFVLASANWISTLLINLNPAMRFDGYYLLMDWLGVENLQSRAFNVTRHAAYRAFFNIRIPDAEPKLSGATKRALILYASYTFVYRLVLYTAIALFVYYKFTKTLGIFLFGVEILLFFIWPVVYEASLFRRVLPFAKLNERTILSIAVITILTLWAIIPFPHTLSFAATTLPVDDRTVYVSADGRVVNVVAERGRQVKKGDLLVSMESIDLSKRLQALKAQADATQKKMEVASDTEKLRSYYQEKLAELAQVEAEAEAVNRQLQQLQIIADVDGYVYDWDQDLHAGQYVSKDQIIGRVASGTRLDVMCFIPEYDISSVEIGQQVIFRPKGVGHPVQGTIERISPVRATMLDRPQLGSLYGGPLAIVEERKGEYRMLDSYFPVLITLDERDGLALGEEGVVRVRGPWTSYLMRLIHVMAAVLTQESNL